MKQIFSIYSFPRVTMIKLLKKSEKPISINPICHLPQHVCGTIKLLWDPNFSFNNEYDAFSFTCWFCNFLQENIECQHGKFQFSYFKLEIQNIHAAPKLSCGNTFSHDFQQFSQMATLDSRDQTTLFLLTGDTLCENITTFIL